MKTNLRENGSSELIVALLIVGLVVVGMYLVSNNGQDIFTWLWSFVASLME